MSAATATRPGADAVARLATGLHVLGAACLGVEGAVHLQQLVQVFHSVAWIGPLFATNAAACAVTVGALAPRRTRPAAALAGIVVSAGALVALALSYTVGLLGWTEVGLRPPVELAIASEIGAIVALAGARTAMSFASAGRRRPRPWRTAAGRPAAQ